MPFLRFLAGRLAAAVLTVIGASALTYTVLRVLYPEGFGEDRGLLPQLWDFLVREFVHGDLGNASEARLGFRPIRDLIADGLPADLSMIGGALVLGVGAGILAGVTAGRRPGGGADRVLGALALIGLCAPVYWVGLALIELFTPGGGTLASIPFFDTTAYVGLTQDPPHWFQALLVPWCVAGAPLFAVTQRMTRAMLLDAGEQDYLRTALAKGLDERRVAYRHALPPALAPTVAVAGTYTPLLVGNVLLVEKVFGIPGMFQNVPTAIDTGDFTLLQGLIIVGAVLVVIANLVADLVLARLDPRTRGGG